MANSARRTLLGGVAFAGLSLCAPGLGSLHAETRLQTNAAASVGVTDNALLAPDGSALVTSDLFVSGRGGVTGIWAGAQQESLLTYMATVNRYLTATRANTQSHRLEVSSQINPTGRTQLHLLLGATLSRLNAVDPLDVQTVITTTPTVTPTGPVSYLSLVAGVDGTFSPDPLVLWRDATMVRTFKALDGPQQDTVAIETTVGHERHRGLDAFIATVNASLLFANTSSGVSGVDSVATESLLGTALVGWAREITPVFNSRIELGALAIMRLGGGPVDIGPSARASVQYHSPAGVAGIEVFHAPQLNLYLGQGMVADGVTVRATLPLDRAEQWRVLGLGTAQRSRLTTDVEGSSDAMDLLNASVDLTYRLLRWPLSFSLDYSRQQQIGHSVAAQVFPSLKRQVLSLMVAGRWPSTGQLP